MGNLKSVQKAFLALDYEVEIVSQPEKILNANKIVLPGVGAFKDASQTLNQTGMSEAIYTVIKKGVPFLGICLGMQLLFEKSYEYGEYQGLGLLKGEIVPFNKEALREEGLKVPHMGWNTLEIVKQEPLFNNIKNESSVYFVHSYYLMTQSNIVSSFTNYGTRFAVSIQQDNIFATQFHPEKSGNVGLQILKNFGEV